MRGAALGADVPVCLAGRPARMAGIGETLAPLPTLPPLWCVLVTLRVAVATPQVFAALTRRDNPPLPDLPPAALASAAALAAWLTDHTRNDLVPPARAVAPILAEVHTALAASPDCLIARMSGSGGTHSAFMRLRPQPKPPPAPLQPRIPAGGSPPGKSSSSPDPPRGR